MEYGKQLMIYGMVMNNLNKKLDNDYAQNTASTLPAVSSLE